MKKRIIATLLLLIALLTLHKEYQYQILTPTDFKVQQYFFFHGEDLTDARINVIACVTDYDTDKMMQKIRRYFNMLYGEADSLHITLFNNEANFLNYKECVEQTFYKHPLIELLKIYSY